MRILRALKATICILLFSGACSKGDPLRTHCAPVAQKPHCVRLVAQNGSSVGDGLSWCSAFDKVQAGIDAARAAVEKDPALSSCEVWVARGTYYVFEDRYMDTLRMADGVQLYGGFKGTERSRDQRNFEENATVLSGRKGPNSPEQVYHVITGADRARLDGFTVTDGYAKRGRYGGGMYNDRVSPTIANCRFLGNRAGFYGGGIYNVSNAPVIEDCTFVENRARYGAGIASQNAEVTITRSVFFYNSVIRDGGAVMNDGFATAFITNGIFIGNWAKQTGGAIFNYHKSKSVITNSTFVGNYARNKGGALNNKTYSGSKITNSILWDNDTKKGDKEIASTSERDADVSYSLVKGGYRGDVILDADPLLYQSAQGFPALLEGSPCIDAANDDLAPKTDLLGNRRVDVPGTLDELTWGIDEQGRMSWADLGAVEYLPERTGEQDTR